MTLNGKEPPDPSKYSGQFPEVYDITVPYGMEADFRMKFASVDRAGNISSPAETVTFSIDRLPPKPPVLSVKDGQLIIEGEGDIFYTITDNGREPDIPDRNSALYKSAVKLPVKEDQITLYKIAATAVDLAGNTSRKASFISTTVDRRIPRLPQITGMKDGGLYNSAVTIRTENTVQDTEVHYTVSTDSEDHQIPDENSPVLSEPVTFHGIEGSKVIYTLNVLPVIKPAA